MKACLFDIDGTLVQTFGAGMIAFRETFADAFGVAEMSSDVSFAGRSDRAICFDLFAAHGIDGTDANWATFQQGYVGRLPEALTRTGGTVLPGVPEMIDKLEQMGDVHIGLLTGNVRAGAEAKLGYYGLWDRFAFGGFGDRHTDRADIARTAVAEAERRHGQPADNGQPVKVMVIGDTEHDVRCARAVDAYAVAVPTGHTPAERLAAESPDVLQETLADHDALVRWFAE